MNMHSPTKPIHAFAAPHASATPVQIAAQIANSFDRFKAENGERLDALETGQNELTKILGRLTVGGGGAPDGVDPHDLSSVFARYPGFAGGSDPDAQPDNETLDRYGAAMALYLRRGSEALNSGYRAAMSVGADPEGGFWVQPERSNEIISRMFETSPIRQVASVIPITHGDAYEYPLDTNDAISGGWVGEKDSRPETNTADVGVGKIYVHEQYAQPKVTQKLLDDVDFSVDDWLTQKTVGKIGRTENTAFVSGNGTAKPRGFLDYGTAALTTDDDTRAWGVLQYVPVGAAGAFPTISGGGADGASDPDALHDVVSKLQVEFRANARWMMNRKTAAAVKKLKDADGRYLWIDSLQAGEPSQLLGFPVALAEDMPDIASNSFSIAFGDFKAGYTIVDRLGIRLLRDPYTTKGFVKFYITKRTGGDVVNFDAIKLLKFSAA